MTQVIKNRKARFNYQVFDSYEAGIALLGTEIKSIRMGQVDISDAYCEIDAANQIYILQMKINPYEFGNRYNHEPSRPRKILLHKNEILKLKKSVQQKGLTLVPTELYFKHNMLKVKIAVARGRKIHDKAKYQKERDQAHKIAQQN